MGYEDLDSSPGFIGFISDWYCWVIICYYKRPPICCDLGIEYNYFIEYCDTFLEYNQRNSILLFLIINYQYVEFTGVCCKCLSELLKH